MRPGTHYARNQKRRLAQVKTHQAMLGDDYRKSNRDQMRRNRKKRRDRGQVMLPLNLSPTAVASGRSVAREQKMASQQNSPPRRATAAPPTREVPLDLK
jgi:hypothetical protein